ncbi:MAG: phosphodiester glycosidase family protein [Clostridia bacterium]|nr:phosphodiester glycosidase family protein [Clostridia bacterium]
MKKQSSRIPEKLQRTLHIIASVTLNLAIVLSAVYILYHILDHYNPMLSFIDGSDLPVVPHLSAIIPILFVIAVLLYDLLFLDGAFRDRRFSAGRMWLTILIDFILFAAISVAIVMYSCNILVRCGLAESDWVEESLPPVPVATETVPAIESEDPVVVIPTNHEASATPDANPTGSPVDTTPSPDTTPTPVEWTGLIGEEYAYKFSEEPKTQVFDRTNVVETLPDGTVKALVYSYSGKLAAIDIYHFSKGKEEYQVADIYIRDIRCFVTAYELDAGKQKNTPGYSDSIGAIVAVNGDNFGGGKLKDGLIVRNGQKLTRKSQNYHVYTADPCFLFEDGTMKTFDCKKDNIDSDALLSSSPALYQAFYFGPSLLNEDGSKKDTFNSTLRSANPRTVLGYYAPGHYAFIVVLGDRSMIDYTGKHLGSGKANGMTLSELSALCESLGMKAAYNLDGGGSSSMCWNKTVFGHNDRPHSDILAIIEP